MWVSEGRLVRTVSHHTVQCLFLCITVESNLAHQQSSSSFEDPIEDSARASAICTIATRQISRSTSVLDALLVPGKSDPIGESGAGCEHPRGPRRMGAAAPYDVRICPPNCQSEKDEADHLTQCCHKGRCVYVCARTEAQADVCHQ